MHTKFLIKYYFIDKLEGNNIESLDNNTSVIYRNYNSKKNINDILKIQNLCKKKKIKFFISNDLKLAIKLNCDGLYLPSFNKHLSLKGRIFKQNFRIIGSAHNIFEIRQKELQGVKKLFISSVFKKNKNYLGIYKFLKLKEVTKKDVVPLGGVNYENIRYLKCFNILSFAGISAFKKKTPLIY